MIIGLTKIGGQGIFFRDQMNTPVLLNGQGLVSLGQAKAAVFFLGDTECCFRQAAK
jgi:hypothetical protein